MAYRLFIEFSLFEAFGKLPKSQRFQLEEHFSLIQAYPGQYAEYIFRDQDGRDIAVSFFGEWSIHFWVDEAVQEVKILRLAKRRT